MGNGFEFDGNNFSELITHEYSELMAEDITKALSDDELQKVSINCEADEGEELVSIWQWVTTSNDGLTTVYTDHIICRYGEENFNTEPVCPLSACTDS